MSEFKEGDHVFLYDGSQARYVGKHPWHNVYFIQKLFCGQDEYGQEDIELGSVEETRCIYKEEPIFRKSSAIKDLEKKIDSLNEKYEEKKKQILEMDRNISNIKNRCCNIDALKNVFDFIDGKITHFVNGSLTIRSSEESLKYDVSSGRSPKYRLLSLYGESEGNICWRIDRYSDGSGGGDEVKPFTNYEDAFEYVRKECEEKCSDIQNGKIKVESYEASIIYDRCVTYGFYMCDNLKQYYENDKKIRRETKLKNAQESYDRAKKVLEDAMEKE